ncbi:MAG: glycosyltransferase family 2 protein [Xanthobacteraceae bacterium]
MVKSTIAVCIASFNRREKTLSCLQRLYSSRLPSETHLVIHLLDDASSDGTAAAVAKHFPSVHIHHGDGNCFWAGGMRVAYGAALAENHDYYLWLNDDVELFPDSLERAIATSIEIKHKFAGEHLIIGATRKREAEVVTYSGFERSSSILPWKFRRIAPFPTEPRECHTINGNFVLISREVAQRTGSINSAFVQMHADLTLGLIARQRGIRNWILPGYIGICDANVGGRKDWKAPGLTWSERLRLINHPLGYPFGPSWAYSRLFGLWAPLMVVAPYIGLVRAWLTSLITKN